MHDSSSGTSEAPPAIEALAAAASGFCFFLGRFDPCLFFLLQVTLICILLGLNRFRNSRSLCKSLSTGAIVLPRLKELHMVVMFGSLCALYLLFCLGGKANWLKEIPVLLK